MENNFMVDCQRVIVKLRERQVSKRFTKDLDIQKFAGMYAKLYGVEIIKESVLLAELERVIGKGE